ncbi:transcription factor-like 5 protein isoform X3 [Alligator mississippiensis]|uniref:transcription factor-like 5 protein isoform X3 n=1 Tax=Alligator mississippiensis TaxID=8496 RepID=UPI00287810A4|nr:transcription factor-like 5 protein isoform X3 [Alligator mississippiensis]
MRYSPAIRARVARAGLYRIHPAARGRAAGCRVGPGPFPPRAGAAGRGREPFRGARLLAPAASRRAAPARRGSAWLRVSPRGAAACRPGPGLPAPSLPPCRARARVAAPRKTRAAAVARAGRRLERGRPRASPQGHPPPGPGQLLGPRAPRGGTQPTPEPPALPRHPSLPGDRRPQTMSGPGAKGRPALLSPATGPEGPLGEHNMSFTTTDLNLVEMTEIEYTQLQHILYSHMEAQANEGDTDARLNSALFSACEAAPHQPAASAGPSGYSSANPAVYPAVCQSGLAPESGGTGANQCLGHVDFQELRMMLLSESNLPAGQGDKTPNASRVDVAGHGLARVKHGEKENVLPDRSPPAPEPRSKSAVRVRLEDRFNSIRAENPRCQEPQEPGATLNNLVTLIRQPSELMGVPLHQQPNKCTTLVKNKTTATTTALQFAYPLFTMNASSSTGNANPSQTQSSGASCTTVEAAKHQDLGLPRAFSFCYHQEIESTKQTVGARNKALPEQVWIKVGGAESGFAVMN